MGKNRGGGGGSTPRCHTWEVALSLRAGGGSGPFISKQSASL